MFNNNWNPRNRNMPYPNHLHLQHYTQSPLLPRVSPNGDPILIHHTCPSYMRAYIETAIKLQQEKNQAYLNPNPSFPSPSNIFDAPVQQMPLQIASSFRESCPRAPLLQPQVFPLAPRNYSLRPMPNHVLPQVPPRTQSRTDLTLSTSSPLNAINPLATGKCSAVEEPIDGLTMPYLNQLDCPVQQVVDLVESDNEENASKVVDLSLKL